jgi:pseudaminic acid biosynthesis-associated methylase
MNYTTEQETFWAGEFGNEYIERNLGEQLLAYNLQFFARALRRAQGIRSVIEFGANIGMNLKAMKMLSPKQEQFGIEINSRAADELERIVSKTNVYRQSVIEFGPQRTWDLAPIKGVLIHINPEKLNQVYEALYRCSNRYLLIAEYYNPTPVEVSYYGHQQRLFKRDFVGELMSTFRTLD